MKYLQDSRQSPTSLRKIQINHIFKLVGRTKKSDRIYNQIKLLTIYYGIKIK